VNEVTPSRFTPLGRLITIVLIAGLIALGARMVLRNKTADDGSGKSGSAPAGENGGKSPAVSEVATSVPTLSPAAPYVLPENKTVAVEISKYAGYAGLVAANGGLDPSENSVFFKDHGFKVKLTISEGENWSELNAGKIAASTTTADVLAVYGRQFHAAVPAQIGYSRGADGLVVRSDIKKINDLKGKVVATAQFTEVDFFLRYLVEEAGLAVNMLGSLDATPSPDRVNLVYTEEGFAAGDLFLNDLKSGKNKLAGCVTWEPKVSEVIDKSGGTARLLASNKNLLVIADILVVNEGLAKQHPEIVAGLVHGLLEGNRLVRDQQASQLAVVGKAFGWTGDEAKAELSKVHLANLPENLAFFSGAIDAAGSFNGIYQSAVLAYGSDLVKDPPDPSHFVDTKALDAIQKGGQFKEQKVAIAPIRSSAPTATLESNPLLSKNIRFLFEPNSSALDMSNPSNLNSLQAIKQMLTVSPGSTVLLRGHVDNARVDEFRKMGGEAYVRQQALRAMALSRDRAAEIKKLLLEKYSVDNARIDVVGRGWEEPIGGESEQNRRVEVQWFTIE
jgi:NitT/TauT family transport system substrate-binding protein